MKKNLFLISTSLFCLVIFSCSSSKPPLYSDSSFDKPFSIVVLPFENQTTDLAVSELTRLFFVIGMEEKGYDVLDLSSTDSILMTIGITDGGQLASITEKELHNIFNGRGLLFGNILDAEYSTLAVVQKQNVKIHITLYKDNELIWEDEEEEGSAFINVGGILNPLQGLAQQVVDKSFQKMFAKYHGHPLELLTESVAYKLQEKMPGIRKEKSGWN